MSGGEVPCPRCQGRGSLEGFRHVEGGRCYQCQGRKTIPAGPQGRPSRHTTISRDDVRHRLEALYRIARGWREADRGMSYGEALDDRSGLSSGDRTLREQIGALLARADVVTRLEARRAWAHLGHEV